MMVLRYMTVNRIHMFLLVAFLLLGFGGKLACAEENDAAVREAFEKFQIRYLDEPVDVPDFSLPLVGGGEAALSDYKGKIVFLNFWATWCPHCREEREDLQTTYDKYKDKAFVVLSISVDRAGIDTVEQFINEQGLTFPNMHDRASKVALEYGVRGIPVTYVVGADGKIIGGVIGPREWASEAAHGLIEELLRVFQQ
ncbi:thiol-disulfide oxidoreductase [candidate division KSB3 bacterium]|uniref:Thiol-disulfide oxidoreductase n=1 Tax=candidate division KSB3 bacterium TaxID=2044937 RepID=A0A2G6KDK9_9BACT|nr:MAG: thiol-disulfide oxidoreductase [candidate division KSB3 bacterium]